MEVPSSFLYFATAFTVAVGVFTLVVITFASRYSLKAMISLGLHHIYGLARGASQMHIVTKLMRGKKAPNTNLPAVEHVEKVSNRVYRILGQNPGYHTLQGTNIYLVTGTKTNEHVLIDTGESWSAKDFLAVLFDEVFTKTNTKRLKSIILTHGHGDHQGGVLPLMEALRDRGMLPLPQIYKRKLDKESYPAKGFDCIHIEDNQQFIIDSGTTLQAVYTPGHTDDHVAFILKEDHAIITGDCVLGCGTTVFDDLHDYMRSLDKLRQIVMSEPQDSELALTKIYPGHGPIIQENALGKIDEYIHHRLKREDQVLDALRKQSKDQWVTSLELVEMVYGRLSSGVFLSAQSNLRHHLSKLLKDNNVEHQWPDMWRIKQ